MSLVLRPRREAVVRTPLDAALIRHRILALAAGGPPTGFFAPVLPRSYFSGGRTSGHAFALDHHFGTRKHPQVYAVRGEIVETAGGCEVRLVCESRAAWTSAWMTGVLAVGTLVLVGFVRPRVLAIALAALIACLFALHAFTALVVTPAAATGRIARAITAHLEGVAP